MKELLYDTAVIGAGIGGMCVAARLAHNGYKVLVAEKLPFLGGRCSTTEYKGFKLSTGAIGVEIGGPLEQTFRDVGAPFQVRRPDPQLAYRLGGRGYIMPPKGGLRWLLHQVAADEGEAERVMGAIKRGLAWQRPSDTLTLKEWLSAQTNDASIHHVIQAVCAALLVVNYYEAPAGTFFRFLKAGGYRDFGFAPNGNLELIRALERVIIERGGEVWTRARVRRILVQDGTATGMVVERGGAVETIKATAVVSNASPRETVKLAGPENLDRGYLREVYERQRPGPVVAVFVASDRPLMDHPGILLLAGTRRVCLMVTPTLTCPELAPKGQHYLESFGPFRDSLGPVNLKEEVEMNLQDLRENTQGFDQHGRLLMVQTFYRDWPALHTWPGYEVPPRTPIELLYNVGDGSNIHGTTGLPGCAETARAVAEDIMARVRPRS
jgi:phytoene dehydrogenase-like protein